MRTATNQRIYNSALIPQHSVLVVALCALLFALCSSATAQQPKKVPRIGYLSNGDSTSESTRSDAIRLALRELGYIEGQNIAIEYRYAERKRDQLSALADELVRLKVDIVMVAGGPAPIRAAMKATKTIPILMVGTPDDPVEAGLVKSLARPGGNVTGLTNVTRELGGKRLELLKEVIPKLCRVAVLWNPLSVSDIRLERNPTTSTAARNPASFPGSAELQRFRPSARRRNQGGRGRSCHPGRPRDGREYKTDSGPCSKEPPAVDISRFCVRGRWRSSDLWRPPSHLVPPRRHLRGQDPEGRETRQSAD